MTILLDTHLVLWMVAEPERLPGDLRELVASPNRSVFYSAANIWEIAIKASLGRADFKADPEEIRLELEAMSVPELPIRSVHTAAVAKLPDLHRDPFDRVLVAQAATEGMILHTADRTLSSYGDMVRVVE